MVSAVTGLEASLPTQPDAILSVKGVALDNRENKLVKEIKGNDGALI
jgi:hypothetical protein